jgi:hypothetical protein
MFAQKIESIEAQIQQLQQQQAKYQNLHAETVSALDLISKIREQAAALGESDAVAIAFMEALQIQPDSEVPTTIETESHTEIEEDSPEEGEDDEWESESLEEESDKYSTPSELAAALESNDTETVLLEIANVLDSAPATEIQGKVWYFVRNLPVELGDRIISYLPKSIVPEWRKQMDVLAEEAKASIFPESQITVGIRVAIKNDGEQGTVSWLGQNNDGEPVASVTVSGGTRGSIPVEELEVKADASPNEPLDSEDPEVDELARLCLKQKAWSQMRLFADRNPNVIIQMQKMASTKAELRIINNLPSLILGYIGRANDRSDLAWIPENVLTEVEALLAQPQEQSIA